MNFRNLKYFLTAAEEKSITRAAQRLYISQQSLSGQIARLEEELGVRLFERTPTLKLSYAGERLALFARRICSLEEELQREAGEISQQRRGRLRLGISYTCGRAILPSLLPDFCAEHPQVEISLMEGNSRQLNDWLSKGEIDVLIGYLPIDVPGAEVFPILNERLFLACPKTLSRSLFPDGTIPGGEGRPDLRAFRGQPFILLKKGNRLRAILDRYMEKADFLPNVTLETENIETAFALASQGLGITVYPELFLSTLHGAADADSARLDFFPLPGSETTSSLAVALTEKSYLSPSALDLAALFKQQAPGWLQRSGEEQMPGVT